MARETEMQDVMEKVMNIHREVSVTRVSPAMLLAMLLLAALVRPAVASETDLSPLDCLLEPFEVVEISSAVEGVIEEIHVDRNQVVSRGQLLVELDDEVERAQVDLAYARAAMVTNIELRETELSFNLRTEERMEHLFKTDTISEHVRDEASTDTRKSRLQLRNAREAKRLAELELAKAQAILDLRSMTSPIDGVVVGRHKVAGEFVEDESILRIAQLNPLKVEVIVPVEMFGKIEQGMQVEVAPEVYGGDPLLARVTMVDQVVDPTSGTFDVTAELENPGHRIPSGLQCTALFLPGTAAAANVAATQPETAGAVEETVAPAAARERPVEPVDPAHLELLPSEQALAAAPDAGKAAQPPSVQRVAVKSDAGEACESAGAATRWFVTARAEDNHVDAATLVERIESAGITGAYRQRTREGSELVQVGVYSKQKSLDRIQQTLAAAGVVLHVQARSEAGAAEECAEAPLYASTRH